MLILTFFVVLVEFVIFWPFHGPMRPALFFWTNRGLLFVYFRSFQTNITTCLQQIYVKNVHPEYGAWN